MYVVIQHYLDILALPAEGARSIILAMVQKKRIIQEGSTEPQIPLSTKTAIVATGMELESQIKALLNSIGTASRNPGLVRDLGVDTSFAISYQRPTHKQRQQKTGQRIS